MSVAVGNRLQSLRKIIQDMGGLKDNQNDLYVVIILHLLEDRCQITYEGGDIIYFKVMENNSILLAGYATKRGIKIARFLSHKGYAVFGMDRHEPLTTKDAFRFFRMGMNNKEAIKLAMIVSKPQAVIFCPDTVDKIDYNYLSYSNVLSAIVENNIKKIVLCLDEICDKPKTINELSQLAMYYMTDIVKNESALDSLVITNQSNLLKEIKHFLGAQGIKEEKIYEP